MKEMTKEEIKKIIKEILEEEGIQRLKIGKHTIDIDDSIPGVHISGAVPKIILEGTETGAKNLSIRENTGRIEIYDETAAAKATPPIFADEQIHKGAFLTDVGSVTVTIPIGGGSATASIAKPATLTGIGAILSFEVVREVPIVDDVYEASYGINASGDAVGVTLAAGTGTTLTARALMMEA